ncbi:hypothetical protein BpHYR1_015328 [Brachionus plicatilis]|uniref:Uncharacterized protein n=1 Tax=Brachionus plicatilis TaxID=10195 RepID=A0A3M7PZ82_BRAPC|nr:hypothetical protein BpHYR1_015328 [Brachionus plicatilis]
MFVSEIRCALVVVLFGSRSTENGSKQWFLIDGFSSPRRVNPTLRVCSVCEFFTGWMTVLSCIPVFRSETLVKPSLIRTVQLGVWAFQASCCLLEMDENR